MTNKLDALLCTGNAYCDIRYNSVYLTCSKKLTCSQLSLPHGTNRKIKLQKWTKNKPVSMISYMFLPSVPSTSATHSPFC